MVNFTFLQLIVAKKKQKVFCNLYILLLICTNGKKLFLLSTYLTTSILFNWNLFNLFIKNLGDSFSFTFFLLLFHILKLFKIV